MATFEMTGPDGSTYHVDAPDEQQALSAFSAFHSGKPAAPAPDKYQQAAAQDIDAAEKNGIGDTGYTRRLVHGATLGADNTIMAAAATPLEMIKHGTWSPSEGYNYAKAREDMSLDRSRKNTGMLGDAAEMLGGAVTGQGVADAGLTATRLLGQNSGLLARAAASGADAAGLGAVSGFNEGNGISDRLTKAAEGAGTGAVLGAGLPAAASVAHAVAAPFIANGRALVNPAGFAESQIARGVHESGLTPDQIADQLRQAAAENQPQFNVADALGNSGQRLMSTVARAPGEGRTAVVNALDARQAGQGRRVANALSEGFDAPQTPDQLRSQMETARKTQADADYGTVRDDAQPVDVSNVLDHIDAHLKPLGVAHDRPGMDGITGRMQAYRRMLGGDATNLDGSAAGGLNDFNAAQMVRHELSDEVQKAAAGQEGNKARLLGGVLRELDNSLENASQGFKQANRNFSQASRNIDAIDQGTAASMRGRTEDTIPAFQGLTPEGQTAFRTGYADPLIRDAQTGAIGVNKARPLTNDAFQDESAAMAPGNALMQRRIARENTMFETRNAATGGSKTQDNFADQHAMEVDPHLVGHILAGNYHGAIRHVLAAGSNALTGNTPAVRREVSNILLRNGTNITGDQLSQMVNRTVQRLQHIQRLGRVAQAARRGIAVALPDQMTPAN